MAPRDVTQPSPDAGAEGRLTKADEFAVRATVRLIFAAFRAWMALEKFCKRADTILAKLAVRG